jgi:hypothetical protein
VSFCYHCPYSFPAPERDGVMVPPLEPILGHAGSDPGSREEASCKTPGPDGPELQR